MSSRRQIKFFRNILSFSYFVVQLYGLWPYIVDKTTRQIKYSRWKFVYSFAFPLGVTYIFYIFGVKILQSPEAAELVQTKAMKVTTAIYSLIIAASYFSLYIGQHIKFRNTRSVYCKYRELVDLLKIFPVEDVDFRKYFTFFFVKTVCFDIFHFWVLWFNLNRFSKLVDSHPFLPCIVYMPLAAIRLYENIFYGGILVLDIAFQQLNKHLLDSVTRRRTSEVYAKNNIDKYCQLSDELDEISNLHFKLCEVTEGFNSKFDIQLTMWISLQITGLLLRCFYIYVGTVNALSSRANSQLMVNFPNVAILFLTWFELFLMAYACDSIIVKVNVDGW